MTARLWRPDSRLNTLVLSGLENSCVGNFSLIRFRKGQTLRSTERALRSPIYIDTRDTRVQKSDGGITVAGNDRKSQAGCANPARRQSLGGSTRATSSCSALYSGRTSLFELGRPNESVRSGSALGRRHNLYRLKTEFVYLAVILDVFSRRVTGRTLRAKLPLHALERAIANKQPPPGVVHHSDQRVQYACQHYMQALHEHGMLPSMSRPANPTTTLLVKAS